MLLFCPQIYYIHATRRFILTQQPVHTSEILTILKELLHPDDRFLFTNTSEQLVFEKFSFSTHAGHKEITDFIYACDPSDVVIYHSDPNNARPHLVKELEQNGITTHSPENGQSYIIE